MTDKSEYDDILQWPFQKKIKFRLINQKDRSKDHVEQMSPSKDSSSFQKPTKDMNIAPGCPLFTSLNRLEPEGFLKNGNQFTEVEVDKNNVFQIQGNIIFWKISAFNKISSVADQATFLYSKPFDWRFYKCELIASFNEGNDGMEMLVFFELQKSEFDQILQYPFSERVECTLVNQRDENLNRKELLSADFNSEFFQRPLGLRNPGKAFPMRLFVDSMKEEGFVGEEGCVFIKVTMGV